MSEHSRAFVGAAALFAMACSGAEPEQAADDHEHDGTAVTIWTDSVELFYEYPPLIAGEPGGAWAIHVTDLEDSRPVLQGRLTLRFEGPEPRTFTADAPARPGIFTPSPSLSTPGEYEVVMEVESPQVHDRIEVPAVQVYESAPPESEEEGAASGVISFLKEQQWAIPFGTRAAAEREISRSIGASGQLVAAAGRLVRIAAPVSGLALAELNRDAPVPGQVVSRGATLAVLAPTGSASSYASLRAEVERLERELRRVERLHEEEAVPRKRLLETRHELDVARAALQGVGADADDDGDPGSGYRYRVATPIDGVVNVRKLELGARVEAGGHLFTVVDPSTVWLEALVRARDAPRLRDLNGASFRVEGSDRVRRTDRVIAVGDVIDPGTRTIRVLLEVANPDRALKIGMLADVRLFTGAPEPGIAIPTDAILEEDGVSVAYVQVGGESFERRILELGPSDGEWTIVRSGVRAGERVVTEGAYQVKLASLSTDAAGDHGHAH